MSKHKHTPCKARRPAWVDPAIGVLWRVVATTKDARHRFNAMAEAVLLDVVFSYTQSANERVLAAHRRRMNSNDPDRRCVGEQSYKALAADAGVSMASIRWANSDLEAVNAIRSNDTFNYNSRGNRDDNSYWIGEGTFLDQIRTLVAERRHVATPVAVCAAFLAALDPEAPDGDVAHVRLDQLMEATGLAADTLRKAVKAEVLAKRVVCVEPDRFRFIANKSKVQASASPTFSVSSRRRKVVLGAETIERNGNQHQDSGGKYRKARKVSLGAESSGNRRSPSSQEYISRLNGSFPASYYTRYYSSVGARTRARNAASTTPVVVPAERIGLDALKAKAMGVIANRRLADLTDDEAYGLMLDAVADRMPPNVMRRSDQRALGLSLFRNLAAQWPESLVHVPSMAFTFLWAKVENKLEPVSSWRYFRNAVAEFLATFSLPPADNAFPAVPAARVTPPALQPGVEERRFMADQTYSQQRADAPRLQSSTPNGLDAIIDGIRRLELPFADPEYMWSGQGLSNARQSLKPRLARAAEHGRGADWILKTIAAHRDDQSIRHRWSGIGVLIDHALADEVLGPQLPRHASKAGIYAYKARLGQAGLAALIDRVRSLELPFLDTANAWSGRGRQGAENVLVSRIVRAMDVGLDEGWVFDTLAGHPDDPRIPGGWLGVGAMLDDYLQAAFDAGLAEAARNKTTERHGHAETTP